jgi:hypothetical protein
MASKIMQFTKLFKDGFTIELVPYWIPFNSALPIVVAMQRTVLAALTHDASSVHGRTGAKLI